MTRRLLIIGGGPAGLEAARAYREHGGEGEVLIVSSDTALPYERPALSKDLLRGQTDETQIGLEAEDFYAERSIEVRLGTTVSALAVDQQRASLSTGEQIDYDTCIITTGAAAKTLPVPGANHPAIHTLRSLADARRLLASVDGIARVAIVGSGFIGCEVAASLARRKIEVTVISDEPVPQAGRLGPEVGELIAGWLRSDGCRLILGKGVSQIEDGRSVELEGGRKVNTDLLVVAGGAQPQVDLARDAGIDLHEGRIWADEYMRTNLKNHYAAGDVAFAHNVSARRMLAVEHWGEAMEMGRIAGANAAGAAEHWDQAPGFWSTIGDRTLKHIAWGDGFDECRLIEHEDGGFTAWYGANGVVVGVLTHDADDDDERGRALVESGALMSAAVT